MTNNIDFSQNIARKMVLIANDMKYVQKGGFNDFHKYNYVSASDISKLANQSLVKHRVATFVNHEVISIETITNNKGKQERLATVKANVTFVDSDSGEMFTSSGLGSGQDAGDKAVMKAQTAALKYVFLQAFNIESGDRSENPEYDVRVDERSGATPRKYGETPNRPEIPEEPNVPRKVQQNNVVRMEDKNPSNHQINTIGFAGKCSCCGATITDKVEDYSMRRHGRPLCIKCQDGVQTKKVPGNPASAPQHYSVPDSPTPFDDKQEIPF